LRQEGNRRQRSEREKRTGEGKKRNGGGKSRGKRGKLTERLDQFFPQFF